MPQLNVSLVDMIIMNSFVFLYICDWISLLSDTDDDLLEFNNVTLLINERACWYLRFINVFKGA